MSQTPETAAPEVALPDSGVSGTAVVDAAVVDADLPEQMQVRRDKRDRLLAEGKQAFPVSVPRTHTLAEVREQWGHLETGEETQDVVGVAGRVIFIRNTGKLAFATLQEGIGTRLQVTNKHTGKSVVVRINDRGPFIRGRVLDLSRGAARQLGFVSSGHAAVCMARL